MRYILNNEGYIFDVSFGAEIECSLGTCTEYKGKVPSGYSTIEEWFSGEIERLNAWKIVDGNLVYDASRDYKLKLIHEKEEEENRHITKKEMGIASTEEIRPFENIYPNLTTEGSYINSANSYDNIGNFSTEKVELWNYINQDIDFVELEFIGRNFLPNTAIDTINNGIEYKMNVDKTINISGTATDKSTLNLAGTETSVRHIFTFKRGETLEETDGFSNVYYDYVVSGLTDDMSLEFYNYDGVDRTLVGIYKNNDVIRFEQDTNVTQVLLTIEKGTSIDTKIAPMMFLASGMLQHPVLPMKKYKGNLFNKNSNNIYYDGRLNTSGGAYGEYGYYISEFIPVKPYKTYTKNSPIADTYHRVAFYSSNGTAGFISCSNDNTFTIPQGAYYLRFCGKTEEMDTTQLIEGTEIIKYEPYNGKNGQYYVDGISTQEVRSGKNLFKLPNSITKNGITLTNNGDGTFNITGTATANTSLYIAIPLKESKIDSGIYTISCKSKGYTVQVDLYGTSWLATPLYRAHSEDKLNATATINITSDVTTIRCIIYIPSGKTINLTNETIQVEKGSTATEYEVYGVAPSPDYPSEIINIYKAGTYNTVINNKIYELTIDEDLRSASNVADRLWFDADGSSGIDIETKVGSIVLNGSESWATDNITGRYITVIDGSYPNMTRGVITSTHFRYMPSGNEIGGGFNYNSRIFLYPNSDITTIDEFKTWLSTHNTEVYYELATYTTSTIPEYSHYNFEYEEYKNNTTLIDLADNKFERFDSIVIENNQAYLVKEGAVIYVDENGNEIDVEKETILLGYVSMPRTYTPYTNCYSHQRVMVHSFTYRDPRNIDITKIDLKGLVLITDVETDYNFCEEDLTRVQNYIMGTGDLTNEELDVYDINGDGVVTSYDYVLISSMINGTISNKVTGELEINSTQSKRTIVLKDKDGKILTSLGMNGISTPALSVNGVLVEENIKEEETPTTTLLNGKRVYKKLYIGTVPTTGVNTNTVLFDVDEEYNQIWIDESLSFLTRSDETIPLSFYYGEGNFIRPYIDKMNNKCKIQTGKDFKGWDYNIVLAYTKSDGTEEEPEEPKEEIIEVNKASTITGSTSSSNWTFKTVATEEKVDTVNKTSTVTITNYLGRPSTNSSSYFMGTLSIDYKCGDQTFSETVYKNSGTISSGGWYKLGSHTFTIEHTTEPMNINVGGSMSTSAFNPNSASANGSITLTEI